MMSSARHWEGTTAQHATGCFSSARLWKAQGHSMQQSSCQPCLHQQCKPGANTVQGQGYRMKGKGNMKGKGDMKGKGSMNGKGNMTGKGSMTGKYSTQGKDNKPRRQAKAKAVRQQDRSPPPSPAPPYRHWGLDHRNHRQEGNFDRQICLTALFKSKGQSGIMPNPPPPPPLPALPSPAACITAASRCSLLSTALEYPSWQTDSVWVPA